MGIILFVCAYCEEARADCDGIHEIQIKNYHKSSPICGVCYDELIDKAIKLVDDDDDDDDFIYEFIEPNDILSKRGMDIFRGIEEEKKMSSVYVLVVNDTNHGDIDVSLSYTMEGIQEIKKEMLQQFKEQYDIPDDEDVEEQLQMCSIYFEKIYKMDILD
jgi:hypothetical protein